MIGRLISNAFMWLVLGAVCLMILAIALVMLGSACWAALFIWRIVFGFVI